MAGTVSLKADGSGADAGASAGASDINAFAATNRSAIVPVTMVRVRG